MLASALTLAHGCVCFVLQEEELQRLGLDPSKAYRLDTAETAEAQFKKKEKKPAPQGW